MGESTIQRTFAGGEIAPVLHARADLAKYLTSLRTCRNFIVRREGGLSNRAGFRFVGACKDDVAGKRLVPYVGEEENDSFLIEVGDGYFRFYQNGAPLQVLSGLAPWNIATNYVPGNMVAEAGGKFYCHTANVGQVPPNPLYWQELIGPDFHFEIPTPYSIEQIFDWHQSGNVLTFTSDSAPPRELVKGTDSPFNWVLRDIVTTPTIPGVDNLAGTAGTVGTRKYRYIVTAAAEDSYEESSNSGYFEILCAPPTPDLPNHVTWDPVTGAAEYYVYLDQFENGTFGYIGTSTGVEEFRDGGITPDYLSTPPLARVLFATGGHYPAHSANYQQRRWFARTHFQPDAIWASRIGFTSNFSVSSPIQDDDAVTFRIAGNNHHPIRHMVALKAGLIVLTKGGEWTITGGQAGEPITPSNIHADQETYFGVAQEVRPVVVGNAILYVQARDSIVRNLRFDQAVEGLAGTDLTLYASHLFERKTIVDMDFQQTPHSIIWCVRNDGTLLGLTYIPEQDIWGWHRHDTDGIFEDCCVVPELEQDVLYVIVSRTINGETKRYIEKLERREIREGFTHAETFFVDSGLSYSSETAADSFAGLDHLNGKVVAVVADGQVLYDGRPDGSAAELQRYTVVGGTIHLQAEHNNVHIGLPIRHAEVETLDLDVEGTAIRDRKKRVHALSLLIDRSSRSFSAGPDSAHLRRYASSAWEPTGVLESGGFELNITSNFTTEGRLLIRQTDPLPLTILGIIPHTDLGG